MPVVVALLNSYSGLASAATGFAISNNVLIVIGCSRRRVGIPALDAHEQGDEPLVRERVVRRFGSQATRARGAAGGA
jgi:hypothetical protein